MNSTLDQRTTNVTELQGPVPELQALRQYLDLLKASFDRYEHLKESGVPDVVLYTEKGLIDRQLLFLRKVCLKLKK